MAPLRYPTTPTCALPCSTGIPDTISPQSAQHTHNPISPTSREPTRTPSTPSTPPHHHTTTPPRAAPSGMVRWSARLVLNQAIPRAPLLRPAGPPRWSAPLCSAGPPRSAPLVRPALVRWVVVGEQVADTRSGCRGPYL